MRFFAFFAIPCVIFISAKVAAEYVGSCKSCLNFQASEVSKIKMKIDEIDLNSIPLNTAIEKIKKEEINLVYMFQETAIFCCTSFNEKNFDVEVNDWYLPKLINIMDGYNNILSLLKYKKPSFDKNDSTNSAVKDLIKKVGTDATKLMDCVYSDASPKRKPALSAVITKFSEADASIKMLYGV